MNNSQLVKGINNLGNCIGGGKHLIGLDPDELITVSQLTTGLSDFGEDAWRAGFYEAVKNVDESTENTTLSRLYAKTNFLLALRARLFVTNAIKQKPPILDEAIHMPIVITGMSRSGTNLLHRILAQDPNFRTIRGFEATLPIAPPPDTIKGNITHEDIGATDHDLFGDIFPEIKSMHQRSWNLPISCASVWKNTFMRLSGNYPSYQDWLKNARKEFRRCCDWEKSILQILQFNKQKKRHWIFKYSMYTHFLDILFEYYPDIRIIQTHRDPLMVILSLLRLQKVTKKSMDIIADKNSPGLDITKEIMLRVGSLRKVMRERNDGIIPKSQITDLHFSELMRDPVNTLRTTYNKLNLDFGENFDKRIENYIARKPRYEFGKYQYTAEEFGVDEADIRKNFLFYTDYYDISLGI